MFVVHATARLPAGLGSPTVIEPAASTTSLGAWYATVLRWRSPGALFVNEVTLLPVHLPPASARTLCGRFPPALAAVLAAHDAPTRSIEAEIGEMDQFAVTKSATAAPSGWLADFLVAFMGFGATRDEDVDRQCRLPSTCRVVLGVL